MAKKKEEGIQFFSFSISSAISFYIKKCLKHKDWDVEAIDVVKNKVVVKRYPNEEA